MQDPNLSNDENYCKSVNDVINFSPIDEEDDQNIEEEDEEEEKAMPQPQPSQTQQPNVQKDWIAAIQETFKKMGGLQKPERETPCLSEVLKSEYLTEIAENKEFQEALIPLLPEGRQSLDELKDTLKSPQFLQALDSLDRAVNNESGASVLASLGLDPSFFYQNYDGSDSLYKGLLKLMKQ